MIPLIDKPQEKYVAFIAAASLILTSFLLFLAPVGMSSDSIGYFEMAVNFSRGNGFSKAKIIGDHIEFFATNNWPPGYPFLISILYKAGLTLLTAAKCINIFFYILSSVLFYCILTKEVRSLLLRLAGILLFQYTSNFIFQWAGSEPPFLCLLLGFYLCMISQKEGSGLKYLPLLYIGIIPAIMCAFRFAGIFFLAAVILWQFFSKKEKAAKIFLLGLPSLIVISVWIIYCRYSAIDPGHRALGFHLPGWQHLLKFGETVKSYLLPSFISSWKAGALLAIFAIFLFTRRKEVYGIIIPSSLKTGDGTALNFFIVIVYSILIICSITFSDYNIPLNSRILSPLFPFLLLILLQGMDRLKQPNIFLLYTILIFQVAGFAVDIYKNGRDGAGYNSDKYKKSAVLGASLSINNKIIYSNLPGVILYYSGFSYKASIRLLPESHIQLNNTRNPDFENEMEQMKRQVMKKEAVIVFFSKDMPAPGIIRTGFNGNELKNYSDGFIIE